ncbi:CRISPR-associated endoribonuclease Cas6 [Thermomicrobium sp. 4228-Ro]|uniref:CRISPR-associated endoribonuclease Cas6 n=1 Tax=Thermomicrobium sp. 4228-Ro TaxID=2993937 RepID=UPI0022488C96|nr:CRISPR-associated endoribonuclease Cas6 [Thermomicrobium sp. 4228-Ro]MCX2727182.1 CRISPR-associated endoribonuclease Cas6 [Thermomicrobium sp. 4228-Ro]
MRLEIRLEPERLGILPLHYREALQAVIYRHLPKEIGEPLHDGHYWPSERPLKLFVFSQLHGGVRYRPGEGVEVTGPVWFRFASPDRTLALGLAAGLLQFGRVRIASLDFAVREIATLAVPEVGTEVVVQALSPITVYRTLEVEGKRRTQYYNPLNEEFGELVAANLERKARALGLVPEVEATAASAGSEAGPDAGMTQRGPLLRVRPLGVHPRAKRLERYKGTWIEGWVGRYRLEGPPELLRLALEAGLGAKNSQGFGYVVEADLRRTREAGAG